MKDWLLCSGCGESFVVHYEQRAGQKRYANTPQLKAHKTAHEKRDYPHNEWCWIATPLKGAKL